LAGIAALFFVSVWGKDFAPHAAKVFRASHDEYTSGQRTMQGELGHSESQPVMTIQVTRENLARWKEYKLLRFLRAYYEAEIDSDKGIEGMASVANVKRGKMIKALNGTTDLGAEAWVRIEKHFKNRVYHELLDAKAKLL